MFGKGQRYRSVMVVGEEGRVIPFRRFKEIAIAVSALALFSTLALGVLGILYFLQSQMVARLQGELDRLQHQVVLLKDQKDVLKAQLVIRSIQKNAEPNAAAAAPTPPTSDKKTVHPAVPAKHAAVVKQGHRPQPAVHWQADIRQFQVKYDADAGSLRAKFRIYNTSTPRKRLSGRIALAFKANGDPPIKWIAVPDVPFVDGRPSGGRAFSIRNYRTMAFKTSGQKAPMSFNTATVFVYSSNGELLLTRDFDFKMPSIPAASTTSSPAAKTEPKKPANEASGEKTKETSLPAQEGGAAAHNGGVQSKPSDPASVDSTSNIQDQTQTVQKQTENGPTPRLEENGSER